LIGHHEVARLHLDCQRPGRRGPDYALDPELLHGPQIGSVVDLVGRDPMAAPVAGKERDLSSFDLSHQECVGGGAIRSVDLHLLGAGHQLVETGPAEYADHHSSEEELEVLLRSESLDDFEAESLFDFEAESAFDFEVESSDDFEAWSAFDFEVESPDDFEAAASELAFDSEVLLLESVE
jgi:hypothetical protein